MLPRVVFITHLALNSLEMDVVSEAILVFSIASTDQSHLFLPSYSFFSSLSSLSKSLHLVLFFFIIYLSINQSIIKPSDQRKIKSRERQRDGWLGSSCDSSGSVRVTDSWSAVSAARKEQGGGVQQLPDQWSVDPGSHHHLLWTHHHLPHCHRCPHLHRLTTSTTLHSTPQKPTKDTEKELSLSASYFAFYCHSASWASLFFVSSSWVSVLGWCRWLLFYGCEVKTIHWSFGVFSRFLNFSMLFSFYFFLAYVVLLLFLFSL